MKKLKLKFFIFYVSLFAFNSSMNAQITLVQDYTAGSGGLTISTPMMSATNKLYIKQPVLNSNYTKESFNLISCSSSDEMKSFFTTRTFNNIYGQSCFFLGTLADKLIFAYDDSIHGKEPWVSDGTTAGTFMLKDIVPGTGNGITAIGGNAMGYEINKNFIFSTANPGGDIYTTDGTIAGTKKLVTLPASGYFTSLIFGVGTAINGFKFFASGTNLGVSKPKKIYRTDGTVEGTQVFDSTKTAVDYLVTLNNTLLMLGNTTVGELEGFYKSDGTFPANFSRISPANKTVKSYSIGENELAATLNGTSDASKDSTYISNGSNFQLIGRLNSSSSAYAVESVTHPISLSNGTYLIDAIYNDASTGTLYNPRYYTTDGTVAGTTLKFGSTTANNIQYISRVGYHGKVFGVISTIGSTTLGSFDGNSIQAYTSSLGTYNISSELYKFNNALYFMAGTASTGSELFKYTDGTTGLTSLEKNNKIKIFPNPANGSFTIQLSNNFSGGTIFFFDQLGIEVKKIKISEMELTIEKGAFARGLYVLKAYNSNGESAVSKFLVE